MARIDRVIDLCWTVYGWYAEVVLRVVEWVSRDKKGNK